MQSSAGLEVISTSTLQPADPDLLPSERSARNVGFHFGAGDDDEEIDLPRSASYTNLPGFVEPSHEGGIKRTFSENVLAVPHEVTNGAQTSSYVPNKELLRRVSQKSSKRRPRFAVSKVTLSVDNSTKNGTTLKPAGKEKKYSKQERESGKAQLKSVSGTIRGFVRKSWISTSRSPSPSSRENKKSEKTGDTSPKKWESSSRARSDSTEIPDSHDLRPRTPSPSEKQSTDAASSNEQELVRRGTILSRARRPLSAIISVSRTESDPVIRKTPSLRSLRTKASGERLSSPAVSILDAPPLPPKPIVEKVMSTTLDSSKRKDPLWGAFRTLEGDYQKYSTKSSALKASVIRSSLLPFLSRHGSQASVHFLRVEDLDRRIMILNKWWTGLLEMLNGRNNQSSISGTDRPVFLDAITRIMIRPEWRLPPLTSSSSPPDTPQPQRPGFQARSTTSFESSGSDFLAESIHHNVRNIFTQNLLSQMGFVVDKMSMRTAPASLVTFCGRACAYAFFYCPGVADILTRLWTVSPESLRRILSECGVGRNTNLRQRSQELALCFPAAVRILSFESHAVTSRRNRYQPQLPLGASSIRWFGPWINRWTGRESDLFFIFTKHFHILVSEFLPHEIPMSERPCVPGLVLVHAQILTVLEATLYRQAQAGQEKVDQLQSAMFDDIEGPDASAATMPLTAANAVRSMAENRLIMLLRDLLADQSSEHHLVRRLYATSFDNITKAAARRMSLFDSNACFVLCDFLEEVMVIMTRFEKQNSDMDLVDWSFWLEVCQKMMESHNTLTEVRLLAFIYSMWHIINNNEGRRRELCKGWLLEKSFFERNFNHWCPMVRGYYLRLLCWRLARIDGEGVLGDSYESRNHIEISVLTQSREIVELLDQRLNQVWTQYQSLKRSAEQGDLVTPSTAPCSPAPGRRLVIIRTDSQPHPANFYMSFENVGQGQQQNSNQATSYHSHSSLLSTLPPPTDSPTPNKKRFSMLRNINPFNAPGNARPGEVTPPSSASEESLGNGNIANYDPFNNASPGMPNQSDVASVPQHQSFAFKFSLEWLDRPAWPSRNRQLSAPKLPQPALSMNETKQDGAEPVQALLANFESSNLASTKYCGRALAEWAQVVSECNGFFDRRKEEGVPNNKFVETPTLSVESFRMFG